MLDRWYGAVGDARPAAEAPEAVLEPLLDDLNTAAALAEIHRLDDPARLRAGANLLGFLGQTRSERDAATVAAAGTARRRRRPCSTPARSPATPTTTTAAVAPRRRALPGRCWSRSLRRWPCALLLRL